MTQMYRCVKRAYTYLLWDVKADVSYVPRAKGGRQLRAVNVSVLFSGGSDQNIMKRENGYFEKIVLLR